MGRSSPPPRTLSVQVLLENAAQLFRATVLKCLPLAMLAGLGSMLPVIYWQAGGHAMNVFGPHDAIYDGLSVGGTVLDLWLIGTLMLRQRAMVRGAPLALRDELVGALRRLPVMLLCWILVVASTMLGLLMLIVPGLFLFVCYLVLLPVVLFDGAGPYAALVRCVQLVRPHWWQYCAAFVIALFLVVIFAFVLILFVSLIEQLLLDSGPAFEAIWAASSIGVGALVICFLCALVLVLHSAASNSA